MNEMEYSHILVEIQGNVGKIVLNAPERLNLLNAVMREELKYALKSMQKDPTVRVVMITGAGKAFSAGGDLRAMENISASAGRARVKSLQQIIRLINGMEKIVIAAVNGIAAGGGMNLAIACDLVIASEKANFRQSFVKTGLIPDFGGLYFLPARVGVARAKELMLTGRVVDASEALSIGLVDRVVPHEKISEAADMLAEELSKGPSQAFSMIKSALNLWPASLETLLELEANHQAVAFTTQDFAEGRRAFLEKRKPDFIGE